MNRHTLASAWLAFSLGCASGSSSESAAVPDSAASGTETVEATPDVGAADTAPPAEDTAPDADLVEADLVEPVDSSAPDTGPVVPEDLDMTAEDFECVLTGEKVRHFRLWNKLGHLDDALKVANSPDGGIYPVGTVIQLIPGEAMVKRRVGYSVATRDWEFFTLDTSERGTVIKARGGAEVVNQFNGASCAGCHAKAEAKWDFICEDTHGCDPLGVSSDLTSAMQDADTRCP